MGSKLVLDFLGCIRGFTYRDVKKRFVGFGPQTPSFAR